MSNQMITDRVEIDVYYDGSRFYYNRRVNDELVVVDEPITHQRTGHADR